MKDDVEQFVCEINVDCSPYYVRVTRTQMARIRKALREAKLSDDVQVTELNPQEIDMEEVTSAIRSGSLEDIEAVLA